ncbi:MAG: hypothetical protein AB7S69_08435 [Salinivirgaceae bacterium]
MKNIIKVALKLISKTYPKGKNPTLFLYFFNSSIYQNTSSGNEPDYQST